MSEQIETARFDYPSPYWDSVGDPALDLIDRMLTVDVEKRITVEQCLQHPWITKQELSLTDSTDGLTGAMCNLDFSKRKLARERTLLSSLNDVRIKKVIETQTNALPVTVYEKNPNSQSQRSSSQPRTKYGEYVASQRAKEATPTNSRNPNDFMSLGDKGDPILYANDEGSIYTPDRLIKANQG